MKLWLDTEFNGWEGDIISMGITSEDGKEFYEVLECGVPVPWVKENVIPLLLKDSISKGLFTTRLEQYLSQWDRVEVIADWPRDLELFHSALLVGNGWMISIPKQFSTKLVRGLKTQSLLPHSAIEDARALKVAYLGEIE